MLLIGVDYHPSFQTIAFLMEEAISAALRDKPDSPVEQITPGWFGRWFIRSFAEPSPNSKRASAPRRIRPVARVDLAVLDQFLTANKSCRELIVRMRGKD